MKDLTEEDVDPELEEPCRCNVHQVKEKEDDVLKNSEENSEPIIIGEEEGEEEDQTKEEELEDPVKQDMPHTFIIDDEKQKLLCGKS